MIRPAIARAIRPVLWLGVPFNAMVAAMVAFPGPLGDFAMLPVVDAVFYRWMLVYFVVLFSATYGWMAMQPIIPRPVVGLAALGKAGVFAVALACVLANQIPVRTFLLACGDLVFALYFFAWMRATRVAPEP